MWMSLCVVYIDRPDEAVESVNPREQGLLASDPYDSVKSESHAPVEPIEKKI